MLVAVRIAAQTQLERVQRQGGGEFVHRRFESEQSRSGTGPAHVAGGRQIEPRQPVHILGIRRTVEQTGPARLLAMKVLVARRDGHRVVGDDVECSAGIRAEPDALDHRRPVAQRICLLARQDDPYGPLQGACRQHRQAPPGTAGAGRRAETAAHERRHDAHIFGLHAEHAAEKPLHVLHALGLVVLPSAGRRRPRRSPSRRTAPSDYDARSGRSTPPRGAPRPLPSPDRVHRAPSAARTWPPSDLTAPSAARPRRERETRPSREAPGRIPPSPAKRRSGRSPRFSATTSAIG